MRNRSHRALHHIFMRRPLDGLTLGGWMNNPLGDALCFFKCQYVRDRRVWSPLQRFHRDEGESL
jgi:hypothetical protein